MYRRRASAKRKLFKKIRNRRKYSTLYRKRMAGWKSIRGDIGASYNAKREVKDKYPIANAVYKTIGRRYSRFKKNLFARNQLRGGVKSDL